MKSTGWFNLHRHGENSMFDGMGKPKKAVARAVSLGQPALAITDHGNICGVIEHYAECNKAGIKPILGVEAYFQPKFNPDKKYFHLTIVCQSQKGYSNMCKLLSKAAYDSFYRVPILTFEQLEEYNEDLIVSSACIGGFIPQMYRLNKTDKARKALRYFKDIFGDRFYLELMPIEVSDKDDPELQEHVNEFLMDLGRETKTKCIITCDSHYISPEDHDTHNIMFKIGKIQNHADYSLRYMPSEKDISLRFKDMHGFYPEKYLKNTAEIADRCNVNLDFKEMIPRFDWGMPSKQKLKDLAKQGLIKKGKYYQRYVDQVKYELQTVYTLGLEDYFLLCWDIVNFARRKDIAVGPGRGSSCGSTLVYALEITDVDPLIMGTTFERFLRADKKKMPDIDMDFCRERRGEIIEYIMKRHPGRAAQIATFGYYKAKNLGNDLARVYGMDKNETELFKEQLEKVVGDRDRFEEVGLSELQEKQLIKINKKYPDVLKHFSKLFGQTRFIGKHAAGVAITVDDISNYCAIMRVKGGYQTCFDLNNLDKIKVLKMDVLGLAAASVVHEAEKRVGITFDYEMLKDKKIYREFKKGNTIGVFQFEKAGAVDICVKIEPESIQDLMAATALNRPAPIQLGILDKFVEGKNGNIGTKSIWYKYLEDTYGCVVYQESVMALCRGLAHMEWTDIDKQMKALREAGGSIKMGADVLQHLQDSFVNGSMKYSGMTKKDALELYDQMTLYLFNKGHGAAYVLTSFYEMYLKYYYPVEFYYALLKYEDDEYKREVYKAAAIKDGCVILRAHVNGKSTFSLKKLDGELVIQEGLSSIKNVGTKTAQVIEELGPFSCLDDFLETVPKRNRNSKVMDVLEKAGALEFDREKFIEDTVRYNSRLYHKNFRIR